ncbi:MAG: Rossmann-like domain-containing protein [Halobacteriaceae archaeon]
MTTEILPRVYSELVDRATTMSDPQVTVGEQIIMVEVRNEKGSKQVGLAHWPNADASTSWPSTVKELSHLSQATKPHLRACGIATLNALSASIMNWKYGDPMANISNDVDVISTVGLFQPAFKKFDDITVRIVERDIPDTIETPPDVTVTTHPPSECQMAFRDAEICFITGSTLVYGGSERYLQALREQNVPLSILIGATASHWPEPAFDAGIDMVAGIQVTDTSVVRNRVARGECGTDLHSAGTRKVYIPKENKLSRVMLS